MARVSYSGRCSSTAACACGSTEGGVVRNVASGVCCSPGTAWAPPAINANARATRTRRCLRLRIMNTSRLRRRLSQRHIDFHLLTSVTGVLAQSPTGLHESLLPSQYHVKSYSQNVAEGACQFISDPEGATECPVAFCKRGPLILQDLCITKQSTDREVMLYCG